MASAPAKPMELEDLKTSSVESVLSDMIYVDKSPEEEEVTTCLTLPMADGDQRSVEDASKPEVQHVDTVLLSGDLLTACSQDANEEKVENIPCGQVKSQKPKKRVRFAEPLETILSFESILSDMDLVDNIPDEHEVTLSLPLSATEADHLWVDDASEENFQEMHAQATVPKSSKEVYDAEPLDTPSIESIHSEMIYADKIPDEQTVSITFPLSMADVDHHPADNVSGSAVQEMNFQTCDMTIAPSNPNELEDGEPLETLESILPDMIFIDKTAENQKEPITLDLSTIDDSHLPVVNTNVPDVQEINTSASDTTTVPLSRMEVEDTQPLEISTVESILPDNIPKGQEVPVTLTSSTVDDNCSPVESANKPDVQQINPPAHDITTVYLRPNEVEDAELLESSSAESVASNTKCVEKIFMNQDVLLSLTLSTSDNYEPAVAYATEPKVQQMSTIYPGDLYLRMLTDSSQNEKQGKIADVPCDKIMVKEDNINVKGMKHKASRIPISRSAGLVGLVDGSTCYKCSVLSELQPILGFSGGVNTVYESFENSARVDTRSSVISDTKYFRCRVKEHSFMARSFGTSSSRPFVKDPPPLKLTDGNSKHELNPGSVPYHSDIDKSLEEKQEDIVEPMSQTSEVVEPMNSTSEVVEPMNSTLEVVEPMNSTSEVVEPMNSTFEVVEPMNSTSEVVEPMNSTLEVVEPMNSTSEVVEPMNSASKVVEQMNSTSEDVEPMNSASKVVEQMNSTSEEVEPMNSTSKVVEPMNSTSEVVEPMNSTSEVVEPMNLTSEVVEPMNSTFEVVEPMNSTSEVVEPMNSTLEVVEPMNSTSEVVEPMNSTFEVVEPMNSTSEVVEPMNSTLEVVEPMNSTSEVVEPMNSASKVVEQMNSTSEYVEPMNSTSKVVEPMNSTSEVVEPMNSTSEVVEPMNSTSEVVEPMNSASKVVEQMNSTSEVVEQANNIGFHGILNAFRCPIDMLMELDLPWGAQAVLQLVQEEEGLPDAKDN